MGAAAPSRGIPQENGCVPPEAVPIPVPWGSRRRGGPWGGLRAKPPLRAGTVLAAEQGEASGEGAWGWPWRGLKGVPEGLPNVLQRLELHLLLRQPAGRWGHPKPPRDMVVTPNLPLGTWGHPQHPPKMSETPPAPRTFFGGVPGWAMGSLGLFWGPWGGKVEDPRGSWGSLGSFGFQVGVSRVVLGKLVRSWGGWRGSGGQFGGQWGLVGVPRAVCGFGGPQGNCLVSPGPLPAGLGGCRI